jgi:methyltransferase-like protein
MYIGRYVNYPLFCQIWMNLNFLTGFAKNIPNFMKIRQMVAEFFHADGRTAGQTDMTKVVVAFHNYANARKIQKLGWQDNTKMDYKILLVPWRSV